MVSVVITFDKCYVSGWLEEELQLTRYNIEKLASVNYIWTIEC